jgi:hypothetical protein
LEKEALCNGFWRCVTPDGWMTGFGAFIAVLIPLTILVIQRYLEIKDRKRLEAEQFLIAYDSLSFYFYKFFNKAFIAEHENFNSKSQMKNHYEDVRDTINFCLFKFEAIDEYKYDYETHRHFTMIKDSMKSIIDELDDFLNDFAIQSNLNKINEEIKKEEIPSKLSFEVIQKESIKRKKYL